MSKEWPSQIEIDPDTEWHMQGQIRFEGGPYHNTILEVQPWTLFVYFPATDKPPRPVPFTCFLTPDTLEPEDVPRYKLHRTKTGTGAVFYQYQYDGKGRNVSP